MDGYTFNRGRVVVDGKDISILSLTKSEVVNLQFDRLLKEMKKSESGPTKGFAATGFVIEGYDDTTDELYEIEHVRRFFRRIIQREPALLYYVNPFGYMPRHIIGALSDYEKFAVGKLEAPSVVLKRDGNLDNVGTHTVTFSMPNEIGQKMIDAIEAKAEQLGFDDPMAELPVLLKWIRGAMGKDE